MNNYDIIIVGGGMAGSALGCLCAMQGFQVAVIEHREPAGEWPKDEIDLRVSALTRASQKLLQQIGVWQRMVELRVSPYQEMHVWDANGSGSIHFDAAELGEPNLGQVFEYRLGEIMAIGSRAAFPLRLQHADNYIKPGVALVADAAHAMHPLAGQGINLGYLDVSTLAGVLGEAKAAGRDFASLRTLRRYERSRKGANIGMLAAMDSFKKLFSNDHPALALTRNIGLCLTDSAGLLKHLIARRALGLTGELNSYKLIAKVEK